MGEAGAHKKISFNCMEAIDSEFSEEPQWFKKALEDKCDQPSDDAGLTLLKSLSYLVIMNLVKNLVTQFRSYGNYNLCNLSQVNKNTLSY